MLKSGKYMTPQVGEMVQFWCGGGKNTPKVEPLAAIVTERGGAGTIRLQLILPNSLSLKPLKGWVRFHDDPWVAPNVIKLADNRRGLQGTWSWIPGKEAAKFVPDDGQSDEKPVYQTPADRKATGLAKIEGWVAEGRDANAIAVRLRSYGISLKDVEQHMQSLTVEAS